MTKRDSAPAGQICRAIREERLLLFDYNGHARVVEPYCYGISTADEESLRAIQVRGTSSSGGFGFGKLWNVTRMANVRVAGETFVPDDPKYNPDDSAMKRIICRVEKR